MIQSKSEALVFVYGSLRANEGNHRMLADSGLVAKQCSTEGRLYDTGSGFPAMVQTCGELVYGELYRVTPDILRRLDALEGYYGEGENNHYERVIQTVSTDKGSEEAFVYVYLEHNTSGMARVEYGDWKFYRLQNRESGIIYYSYGSCMDDTRFKKFQKDHLFRNVLGKGELEGYTLKFTHQGTDGTGKADLVETGGFVVGKAYRIGSEALDYLLVREGVRSNAYRPAFVDIRIGDKLIMDALTFLVINKVKGEVAPSKEYLEEIRRGGKTVWLTEYEKRFDEGIIRFFV